MEDDFLRHMVKESQMEYCPFLYKWFQEKFGEISKLPPDRQLREGVAKGDPIPFPRYKQWLALIQVIYPKLSLKKFSRTYNIPYGTVRNWNAELVFNEHCESLCKEYSDLFCRELKKLIDDDPDQINEFVRELKHYRNIFILVRIIGFTGRLLKDSHKDLTKNTENWEYALRVSMAHASVTLVTSSAGSIFASPEVHRLYTKSLYESRGEFLACSFDMLINVIKKGRIEDAVEIARVLKEQLVEDIMPEFTKKAMELYDAAYGKKS